MEQLNFEIHICSTLADAQACAALHVASLPDDVLSRLGLDFVTEHMFEPMVESNENCILKAENDGRIIGYMGVATDPEAVQKKLSSDKYLIVKNSFSATFRHPTFAIDMFAAIFMGYRTVNSKYENMNWEKFPELAGISVDKEWRSSGVGAALIQAGIKILKDKGQRHFVVKTSDPRAGKFYRRNGFEQVGTQNRFVRQFEALIRPVN